MKQACRPKKKAIIMLTLKLFVVRFCRFGSICMDPWHIILARPFKASETVIINISEDRAFHWYLI